jgi:hypothetical protein
MMIRASYNTHFPDDSKWITYKEEVWEHEHDSKNAAIVHHYSIPNKHGGFYDTDTDDKSHQKLHASR